ncbi:MAG: hypothetical protein KKA16_01380 [Alphaproteobacteria bacterium]|nr:hypothetical protein [Alphaproteobacteria bacterium]MBU2379530.1 hypothetical protein [Alphaproteobacteria bacterium]
MTNSDGELRETCGFARLCYQIFVVEKVVRTAEVADRIGLSSGALYGRLRGRSAFRAEEIRRLIAAVPDQRLIRFFADDSLYVIAQRPRSELPKQSLQAATAAILREAIDIMEVVSDALARGLPMAWRDRRRMLAEVKEAETATANLRAVIEGDLHRRPSVS